jgi:hypothetical protein
MTETHLYVLTDGRGRVRDRPLPRLRQPPDKTPGELTTAPEQESLPSPPSPRSGPPSSQKKIRDAEMQQREEMQAGARRCSITTCTPDAPDAASNHARPLPLPRWPSLICFLSASSPRLHRLPYYSSLPLRWSPPAPGPKRRSAEAQKRARNVFFHVEHRASGVSGSALPCAPKCSPCLQFNQRAILVDRCDPSRSSRDPSLIAPPAMTAHVHAHLQRSTPRSAAAS